MRCIVRQGYMNADHLPVLTREFSSSFSRNHYCRTFLKNLETFSAFLSANKQMHLTLLCCLATQASPRIFLYEKPECCQSGDSQGACSVKETELKSCFSLKIASFCEQNSLNSLFVVKITKRLIFILLTCPWCTLPLPCRAEIDACLPQHHPPLHDPE